ncbi:acrB/AcrD/AcrF family protein, partial [Vibrio parahaemolyticus V-223/04]
TLAFLSI